MSYKLLAGFSVRIERSSRKSSRERNGQEISRVISIMGNARINIIVKMKRVIFMGCGGFVSAPTRHNQASTPGFDEAGIVATHTDS